MDTPLDRACDIGASQCRVAAFSNPHFALNLSALKSFFSRKSAKAEPNFTGSEVQMSRRE
jgi:hypothetical protein